jgi:DNA modification methylase
MDYKKDLAERLPELKKIEGFPIGKDEDILALSQPPYYTACPNPYIKEFIEKNGKPYDANMDLYHRKPYTDDIDTNKNDKLTNAHSYHTKSPFHAIQQYIEHYTEPGDIVLDCFTGSGMTGIAAQKAHRKGILIDLSSIAGFLAFNYTHSVNKDRFLTSAGRIIDELNSELGWLYKTKHTNGELATINSILFSENFECPICKTEFPLWDYAINIQDKQLNDPFTCQSCNATIKKSDCKKVFEDYFDTSLNQIISQAKVTPVEILYTYNKKRLKKRPDLHDLNLIQKINKEQIPYWHPTNKIPDGHNLSQPVKAQGYSNVHHLFTKRNLIALSALFNKINKIEDVDIRNKLKISFNSLLLRASRKAILQVSNYFGGGGGYITTISGNWYIPSLNFEVPVMEQFENRVKKINEINLHQFEKENILISTQSSTDLHNIPDNSIDFIFVDPPFGENLMYSELNFLYESWNEIITNQKDEAIMNSVQKKDLNDYNLLMLKSFKNLFRIIKPNRWITIEYHNSSSAIWNGLQDSLNKAGFIIAHTSILKNKGGSFIINVSPNSVSNDLMINAYKPSEKFIEKFISYAGVDVEIDFTEIFLSNLPVSPMMERTEKMLYSKMIAYYLQKGYQINYDAKRFYTMLYQNFVEQDGYWFTANQINSYSEFKKKFKLEGTEDYKKGTLLMFIVDEKSALLWLHSFLIEPKSFSDLSTAFTKISNIQGDIVPDLKVLLDENFVFENGIYRRPKSNIEHTAAIDKREKILKKEFESILIETRTSKAKIKLIRKEALYFGFEMCYKEKRFDDILTIANKLDKTILENSSELNDFVLAAEIMVQGIS